MENWNIDKNREFLEDVRSYPAIWDATDDSYHKVDARADAYRELEDKYHVLRSDMEKKIKQWKGQYKREKAKVESSKGTGTGTNQVYRPKWWGWDCVGFLDEKNVPRRTKDTASRETLPPIRYEPHRNQARDKTHEDVLKQASEVLSVISEKRQDEDRAFGVYVGTQLSKIRNPVLKEDTKFDLQKLLSRAVLSSKNRANYVSPSRSRSVSRRSRSRRSGSRRSSRSRSRSSRSRRSRSARSKSRSRVSRSSRSRSASRSISRSKSESRRNASRTNSVMSEPHRANSPASSELLRGLASPNTLPRNRNTRPNPENENETQLPVNDDRVPLADEFDKISDDEAEELFANAETENSRPISKRPPVRRILDSESDKNSESNERNSLNYGKNLADTYRGTPPIPIDTTRPIRPITQGWDPNFNFQTFRARFSQPSYRPYRPRRTNWSLPPQYRSSTNW